jgi:hypothetical protein
MLSEEHTEAGRKSVANSTEAVRKSMAKDTNTARKSLPDERDNVTAIDSRKDVHIFDKLYLIS